MTRSHGPRCETADPPEACRASTGLSFWEAVMVSFNSGLGPTLSVVAYAASLCGFVGFLFVLLITTATAILEQQTLMRASVDCKATTFQEMCKPIPAWARHTTVWSGLLYLWSCAGFYFDFVASFFEGQICPVLCASNADTWLCQSRWNLSVPILVVIFIVCSPANLSGRLSRWINWANSVVKSVVVVAAVLKGLLTWASRSGPPLTYAVWTPGGFFRATSIIMSSLANTGILPQLAADVQPQLQQRVARWCPICAVSLQSGVFIFVAIVGYGALGASVDLDIFKIYQEKYPDFLTSLLQGGIALMISLNLPLVLLPCKSQVWNFFAASSSLEEVPLWSASCIMQCALTLFFTISSVAVPTAVGSGNFGTFILTIASTAGVWMNLLLPAVVLLYCRLLPQQRGRAAVDWTLVMTVGWILLLGTLCLVDGIIKMTEPRHTGQDPVLSEECSKAFRQHHQHLWK